MIPVQPLNRNILLVNNDLDNREMLTQVLSFEGYHLDEVEDGSAAIRYLQSNSSPCLILLNMDELDAIAEQLSGMRTIPIVAISKGRKRKHRFADACLIKPLDYDLLLNTICLLVSSKSAKKAFSTA